LKGTFSQKKQKADSSDNALRMTKVIVILSKAKVLLLVRVILSKAKDLLLAFNPTTPSFPPAVWPRVQGEDKTLQSSFLRLRLRFA
jgi:hypothetical protein